MVEINFARRRPAALLDSPRPGARRWELVEADDGQRPLVRLGAGVTYTRIVDELADLTPCLAMASRTIGSPQIRNRGTVGGNLGTASPAGDAHPPLLATCARRRARERDRTTPGADRRLLRRSEAERARTGRADPRRPHPGSGRAAAVLQDRSPQRDGHRDDVVRALRRPRPPADRHRHRVRRTDAASGGAAERSSPRRSTLGRPGSPRSGGGRPFGDLVAAAASPIDDVRGTARYRRHALAVLARRCLGWVWESLDGERR